VAAGALLAVAATGALLVVGIRVLGRLDASDEEQPARGLRSGRDWTRPLLAWASPWLRGRDGLAMRLLLKAHLREDWRFTSSIMLLPVALLVYLLVVRGHRLEELPGGLAGVGQAAGILGLWLSMLGLSLGGSASCSTEHQAAWLIGGGVLDGSRALSLQRRLVRCLVPGPMLVLATAGLVWRSGLDPLLAPLAMLPAWLGFEIMLTFVQWAAPSAPFSRAWRREGHGFRHYYLVLILVWPVAMVPVFLLYGRGWWGPPAVLALQALLLVGMRLALRQRVRGRGVYGLVPRTG
jgi:hypothetical protein